MPKKNQLTLEEVAELIREGSYWTRYEERSYSGNTNSCDYWKWDDPESPRWTLQGFSSDVVVTTRNPRLEKLNVRISERVIRNVTNPEYRVMVRAIERARYREPIILADYRANSGKIKGLYNSAAREYMLGREKIRGPTTRQKIVDKAEKLIRSEI